MPNQSNHNIQGRVTFIQKMQPGLPLGEYELHIKQTVNAAGKIHGFEKTRKLRISGERFQISGDTINTRFPAPNSQGDYRSSLPHIVFNQPTLPWEILPGGEKEDGHGNQAPWLALLLIDVEEGIPEEKNLSVGSLQPSATSKTFFPELFIRPDEKKGQCTVIELPVDLFNKVAPSLNTMRFSAHVRALDISKKAFDTDQTEPSLFPSNATEAESTIRHYSVLMAHRLPALGKRAVIHLVSLEGMGPYLPDEQNTSKIPNQYNKVRLVSLHSWSFTAAGPADSFTGMMDALNADGQSTLHIPAQGAPALQNALNMAYTPLQHDTRNGDQTVSWYRGPCLPFMARPFLETPLAHADAALRYDPEKGMFDTSYAAAWELGKLLAFQNQHFANALINWKKQLNMDALIAAEKQVVNFSLYHMPFTGGAKTKAATKQDQAAKGGWARLRGAMKNTIANKPVQRPVAEHENTLALEQQALATAQKKATHSIPWALIVPADISNWMARLRLLHGIPMHYLIPDNRMLPPNSIRFFYLDPNWITAVVDGAFSLGRVTWADQEQDKQLEGQVQKQAGTMMRKLRPSNDTTTREVKTVSGFFLRSDAIRHWPGLEVEAYTRTGKTPLKILRMEQLSPGILLCLVEGEIGSLLLHLPGESLHHTLEATDLKHQDVHRCMDLQQVALTRKDVKQKTSAHFAMALVHGAEAYKLKWEKANG